MDSDTPHTVDGLDGHNDVGLAHVRLRGDRLVMADILDAIDEVYGAAVCGIPPPQTYSFLSMSL